MSESKCNRGMIDPWRVARVRSRVSVGHRRGNRTARRAVVLVFVLAALVLAGALIALIAASLRQQGAYARIDAGERLLSNIADSARAWADVHPEVWNSGVTTTLDPLSLTPGAGAGEGTGVIELAPISTDPAARRLRVHVTLHSGRRVLDRTWEYATTP